MRWRCPSEPGGAACAEVMTMLNNLWKKVARSWWGRMIIGALIGGFTVAFVGVQEPSIFLLGMIIGAALLFFLGRLQ